MRNSSSAPPIDPVVLLAYGGSTRDSAAIPWLAERGAAVVTLTLDIGQGRDTAELRERALACGAARALVLDARDEFARECVLPCVRRGGVDAVRLSALGRPLIARKLVEVAGMEGTTTVAHGSAGGELDAEIIRLDAALRVLAPAREQIAAAIDPVAYARARGVYIAAPSGMPADESNLVQRRATSVRRVTDTAATVAIEFADGVPLALNGVPLTLAELIESLSVIAGPHGVGRLGELEAPAAFVLQRAYEVIGGRSGVVHLRLCNGAQELVTA